MDVDILVDHDDVLVAYVRGRIAPQRGGGLLVVACLPGLPDFGEPAGPAEGPKRATRRTGKRQNYVGVWRSKF